MKCIWTTQLFYGLAHLFKDMSPPYPKIKSHPSSTLPNHFSTLVSVSESFSLFKDLLTLALPAVRVEEVRREGQYDREDHDV